MRIKTQLASMKRSLGASDDADDDQHLRMLIDIAGRRDALFYPWRHTDNSSGQHFYPEIQRLQAGYLGGVIGIEVRASGQSDWKKSHFTRRKLVELGYATAAKSKGQITGLFITELGDAITQSVIDAGPTIPAESKVILELLRRRRSLSESKLFGRELHGDPKDWAVLTELLLPLLHRGLVVADFDTVGRVFYAYRSAGVPGDEIQSDEPARPWGFDSYLESYNSERMRLANLSHEGPELYIPLPATSCGNCFCSPDTGTQLEGSDYEETP